MRTLVIFLSASTIAFSSNAWAKNQTKKAKRVEITFSEADSNEEIPDLRNFSAAELNSNNPLPAAARRWLRLNQTKVENIEDDSEHLESLDQNLE